MAIKLPVLKQQSAEEQREVYLELHTKLTRKLSDAIKAICEKHRVEYENYLTGNELKRLRRFICERRANDTALSYYKRIYGIDDKMNYRAKEQAMGQVNESTAFIHKLTDHWKPDPEDYAKQEEYRQWEKNDNRPAFEVKERPTAEKIIRKDVKEYVDGIVRHFVYKVESKLADIIVHYKDYDCELEHGKFLCGAFEGDVTLTFKNGVNFRVHVMLKTNYSVYGRPYAQYPLTFHNVISTPGGEPVALCSESEILDTMGIIPWKPHKQRKPWETLAIGDIVETTDGTIYMVTRTLKEKDHPARH